MSDQVSGCLICGKPLVYFNEQRILQCARCGKSYLANASCEDGHFICDRCHTVPSVKSVKDFCMSSSETDPVKILTELMKRPEVHMHGPEHHVLVGSALLTAYRNAGGDIDLSSSLDEMKSRGGEVPGGICGMWGTCGAAVSCGIAYSILAGSSPLAKESWGESNLLTSECLREIGSIGGPRCCKRDGVTALIAASKFVTEHTGVRVTAGSDFSCSFFRNNAQCIGNRCPYHKN